MPETKPYKPDDPQPYEPYPSSDAAVSALPPPAQVQSGPSPDAPRYSFGKGAQGALGTAAFMATHILRGYAQGKEAARAKQAMTIKRTTDGLHAAYDMAAKSYYSLYQSKLDKGMKPEEIEKDPEIQQAKQAVDASWAAMMKMIAGQVMGSDGKKEKKKKGSQAGQPDQSGDPQGNPLVGLTSNDPVAKAQAWLAIAVKAGPDVYHQTQQLGTQAAQKAAAPQQAREKSEADVEYQIQQAIVDEEKQTGKPLPAERKQQISQSIRGTTPPKPPAEAKVGTIGAFVTEAAKEAGIDPNNLSAESQLGLQRAWTQAKQPGRTVGGYYNYVDKDTGDIVSVPMTRTTQAGKIEVPKVTAGGQPSGESQQALPKGMVEQGNINLNNRPILKNPDGTISSEISFSRSDDPKHPGKEVLVPLIVNGKKLTQDEAWKHYLDTGEHMGIFDSVQDADAYAKKVHERKLNQSATPMYVLGEEQKQSRGQDRRAADRRQVRDLPAPGDKSALAPGARVIGHTLAQPKAKSQQAVLDSYKKQKTLFDLLGAQTNYINEIKADPSKATPRQDLSLVVAAVRAMNPGSVRLPQQELELEIKAGSWGDRAQRWFDNASTGLLPEDQRQDLFHIVQRETTQAGKSLANDWKEWMTDQPLPDDLKQFADGSEGSTKSVPKNPYE